MPLDPAILTLAAAKTIETIWLVKLEVSPVILATNYREGYTDGADVYAYQPGLSVSGVRRSPGEKTVCEVSFADAEAEFTWLPLDSANQKKPVTIKRVWWNGSSWVEEIHFTGLTGRPGFEPLWVRIECVQRSGRRGKGSNVPWSSALVDHEVLAANTKIEVTG